MENLEKARITKYIKRIPNPKGKGWLYFYNVQQWKDYQETGKLPDQKKEKFNLIDSMKNFFGLSGSAPVREKIKSDYKSNDIQGKYNITLLSWIDHLTEYFGNKEKWDKFFTRKPGDKGEGKKPTDKKDEKKNKEERPKSPIRLAVMKEIFALYGGKKEEVPAAPVEAVEPAADAAETVKNIDSIQPSDDRNNFDTMPEGEKKSGIAADFERWKSGDLEGIIGKVFKYAAFLTNSRTMRNELVTDVITVRKVDAFVSYASDSSSGGMSQSAFVDGLNNGSIIPVGLEQTVKTEESTVVVNAVETVEEKEIRTEEAEKESREGYFNEKPAETLNVGVDVWGARRHNFDTYEKFNSNIDDMERDGTAQMFVTKKNLIGDVGLADKDNRVKNGETPYKVITSYAVKSSIAKMPENSPEARKKYHEFLRAIVRLDVETKTAKEFIGGLREVYANMFGDNLRSGDNIIGEKLAKMLTGSYMRKNEISDAVKLSLQGEDAVASGQEVKPGDFYSYDSIVKRNFGAKALGGVSIKKGDRVKLPEELRQHIYKSVVSYASPEDEKKVQELTTIRGHLWTAQRSKRNVISELMDLDRRMRNTKDENGITKTREYYERGWSERISTLLGPEFVDVSDEERSMAAQKFIENIMEKINALKIVTKIYPNETADVAFVPKKGEHAEIILTYPDGSKTKRTVNYTELSPENIESVKKTMEKKGGGRLNFHIEDKVTRVGGKTIAAKDVKEIQKKLSDDFKFKAVQYGNSMPDAERKLHTQWTAEAFSDLSEILELPENLVTANGKLGIAFGARGLPSKITGLMVGAAAHYERGSKMINLTRANGFGTIAHEWGHFIDNILSDDMSGFTSSKNSKYTLETVSKSTLKQGDIVELETGRKGKTTLFMYSPDTARNAAYPFAKLMSGQTKVDEKTSHYSLHASTVKVRRYETSTKNELAQKIADFMIKDMDEKLETAEGLFADMARAGEGYFKEPTECFARAFEVYVTEKMESANRKNTYLVSPERTRLLDGEYVYPQGEKRKELVKLFDEYFAQLRSDNRLEKALKRFIRIGQDQYVRCEKKD